MSSLFKSEYFLNKKVLLFFCLFTGLLTAIAQPTITSFSPTSGAAIGSSITIAGTGFSTTLSNNTVWFGGVKGTVTAATTTQITVTVPKTTAISNLSVVVGGSTTNHKYFKLKNTSSGSLNLSWSSQYFKTPTTLALTNSASVYAWEPADLDNDGDLDFITASNTNAINIITNSGTNSNFTLVGATQTTVSLTTTACTITDIKTADLNNDGFIDILVSLSTGKKVEIIKNNGNGTYTSQGVVTFSNLYDNLNSLSLFDINRDGKLDIIGSSYGTYTSAPFQIFTQSTTTPFTFTSYHSATSTGNISFTKRNGVADVNNDSYGDVFFLGYASPSAGLNVATGTSSSFNTISNITGSTDMYGYTDIYFLDIDNDGDIDVIAPGQSNQRIYTNNGSGSFTMTSVTGYSRFGQLFDIDNDNDLDFIGSDYFGLKGLQNNTGTYGNGVSFLGSIQYTGESQLLDLTGDGYLDAAFIKQDGSTFYTSIFQGNPSPTITTSGTLNPFSKCSGSASTPQSFNVSGVNMSAAISVAALSGFEYCLTAGGTYTTTLTVGAAGTIASTPVFVRMQNTANSATYAANNIVLSSTGATSVNVSASGATLTLSPTVSTTPNSRCGTGTVALSASATDSGTISWYSALTGGTALTTGTSYTTPSISTTRTYYVDATNACGTSTPRTSVIATVNALPAISAHPTSATTFLCYNGSSSNLSVTASGLGLSYQWYSNGSASNSGGSLISGATTNTYALPTSILGTTYYYCIVSGTCTPSVTSNVSGAVIITNSTAISVDPSTVVESICMNSTSTPLSVTATGSGLSYQWYFNTTASNSGGTLVPGATASTYSPQSSVVSSRYYYCIVNNVCNIPATSAISGLIEIKERPTITATTPNFICSPGTVSLAATSSNGSATLNWYTASTGGTFLGTDSPFTTHSISDTTSFYVDATLNGCTTSSRTLVTATFNTPISITAQPAIATPSYCVGTTATSLSITTTGTSPTYQWYSNSTSSNTGGTIINLATSNSYTPPTSVAGTYYYYCITNNMCNQAVTSNVSGLITINTIPTITATTPSSVCTSGTVTLFATPSSGTVNWYAASTGGVSLATGTSYTTPSISATTTYYVNATDNGCTTATRTPIIATVGTTNLSAPTGNALDFDGTSDYVSTVYNTAYNLSNLTVEAWVYLTATGNRYVATKYIHASAYGGYWLMTGYNGTSNIAFGLGQGSGNWDVASSATNISLNTWTHIAGTYDGTTIKVFINGVQAGSKAYSGGINNTPDGFLIGKRSDVSSYFKGKIDEVRVWNTAKDATALTANMNSSLVGNETGLVGYYDFNIGITGGTNTGITTLPNLTGTSGLNGILNTFALNGTTSNWVSSSSPAITGDSSTFVGAGLTLSTSATDGTWSTSNSSIATVNSSGLVTGVSVGTTTISYTYSNGCTIVLNKSVIINPAPSFTVTGTLSAFTKCSGSASTPQSFNVSGVNMTAAISIAALTGFQYCLTEGGTYTTTLTVGAAGTIASTPIYVRMQSTANNATYAANNIVLSSSGATSVNVSASGTVNTTANITTQPSTSAATYCSSATAVALSVTAGSTVNLTYQWYSKTTSGNTGGTLIGGANSNTYIPSTSTAGVLYYYCVITNPCGSLSSNASGAITVNSSVGGSITGTASVCSGPNSTILTLSGHTGSITRWESSLDNFSTAGTPIVNTTTTYTATNLSATTYYRAVVTSGSCAPANSSVATVAVNSALGGTVSGSTSVCSGTNSTILTLSGHSGSIQWQSSLNNSVFDNISSQTSPIFTATDLTATTYYRAVVTNGSCAPANSSVATVAVNSSLGGTVAGSTTICAGNISTLTLSGHSGSIQWQSSSDNSVFADISLQTSPIYSATNVTATTYYRAVVTNGSCTPENSSTATLTVTNNNTWLGTSSSAWNTTNNWSCGLVPTATSNVIIASNSNQPIITSDVSINSLTINSGTTLTVNSGFNLTVANAVANSGTMTLQNNANLLQDTATTTNSNTGSIIVKRNSASLLRLDHTLWSSPVASQNLFSFSPATLTNRFYTYNTTSNSYVTTGLSAATTFTAGKGYAVRAPNNHSSVTPSAWEGTFTGVPNNGTVPFTIDTNGFNLVGNPYPSPISAASFLTENSSKIEGTIYFYAHSLPMNADGTFPTGTNYSAWNTGSGGVAATLETRIGIPHNILVPVIPTGIIQVGQGFFVKATATGTINFTNAMRESNVNNQFFRTTEIERHRLWLNLTTETGTDINQIAVAYVQGATQDADTNFDGLSFGNVGSMLSSKINGANYVIQGRSLPFDSNDVVALGFKATAAGNYKIVLTDKDGLFLGNQDVFVRDNLMGIEHNIKVSPYVFTSAAGTFDARFQLVYTQTLGTPSSSFSLNSVKAYKNTDGFHVTTNGIVMKDILVYDISGRLIFKQTNINGTTTVLKGLSQTKQVLLLKITSQDNETVTVKVIN